MVISQNGQPYVTFEDFGNSAKASVMKFDGNNWVYVGNAGFSPGYVYWTSMALNTSGQIYLAFMDYANANRATVMTYDFPAGISEKQHSKLCCYPTPATNNITFETSGNATKSQLSVLNLNGQELITRLVTEPTTQIDISMLPAGVYVVRLTNENTVQVGKIIKQ